MSRFWVDGWVSGVSSQRKAHTDKSTHHAEGRAAELTSSRRHAAEQDSRDDSSRSNALFLPGADFNWLLATDPLIDELKLP